MLQAPPLAVALVATSIAPTLAMRIGIASIAVVEVGPSRSMLPPSPARGEQARGLERIGGIWDPNFDVMLVAFSA